MRDTAGARKDCPRAERGTAARGGGTTWGGGAGVGGEALEVRELVASGSAGAASSAVSPCQLFAAAAATPRSSPGDDDFSAATFRVSLAINSTFSLITLCAPFHGTNNSIAGFRTIVEWNSIPSPFEAVRRAARSRQ